MAGKSSAKGSPSRSPEFRARLWAGVQWQVLWFILSAVALILSAAYFLLSLEVFRLLHALIAVRLEGRTRDVVNWIEVTVALLTYVIFVGPKLLHLLRESDQ